MRAFSSYGVWVFSPLLECPKIELTDINLNFVLFLELCVAIICVALVISFLVDLSPGKALNF
jgi:hypothetical protein